MIFQSVCTRLSWNSAPFSSNCFWKSFTDLLPFDSEKMNSARDFSASPV